MSEFNKDLVRRWVEEGWNAYDLGAADRCLHEGMVGRDSYQPIILGREGARGFVTAIHNAFADLKIEINDLLADGDKVAARLTVSGKHQGAFLGREPTGRDIVFPAMTIWRVRQGLLSDVWQNWDALGVTAQIDGTAQRSSSELLALLADSQPAKVGSSSQEQTKDSRECVTRWMNGAWNEGRLDLIDELFTEDFWFYDPAGEPALGREAFRLWAHSIDEAFPLPDRELTIDHLVAEGHKTAHRVTLNAVHGGEFAGLAPTRRSVFATATIFAHHEDGRFTKAWQVFDVMNVLRQVGQTV